MKIAKGYKGFRVEEQEFMKRHWTIKLIWSKKADDKHLAMFHDKESLDIFVEALENKGLKNLTNVNHP